MTMRKRANGKSHLLLWQGDRGRQLMVNRPCSCGCDARDGGILGVGYLSGSDPAGNGFTLWIEDEATYRRLASMLGDRGDPAKLILWPSRRLARKRLEVPHF